MICETRVLSITVKHPIAAVRAYLSNPLNFAQWASGLAGGLDSIGEESSAGADPTLWTARTSAGELTVRFTPANDYGVADHWVFLPDGTQINSVFAPHPIDNPPNIPITPVFPLTPSPPGNPGRPGTNKVHLGVLEVENPGETITGIAPLNGQLWGISDEGNLYRIDVTDNSARSTQILTATDL